MLITERGCKMGDNNPGSQPKNGSGPNTQITNPYGSIVAGLRAQRRIILGDNPRIQYTNVITISQLVKSYAQKISGNDLVFARCGKAIEIALKEAEVPPGCEFDFITKLPIVERKNLITLASGYLIMPFLQRANFHNSGVLTPKDTAEINGITAVVTYIVSRIRHDSNCKVTSEIIDESMEVARNIPIKRPGAEFQKPDDQAPAAAKPAAQQGTELSLEQLCNEAEGFLGDKDRINTLRNSPNGYNVKMLVHELSFPKCYIEDRHYGNHADDDEGIRTAKEAIAADPEYNRITALCKNLLALAEKFDAADKRNGNPATRPRVNAFAKNNGEPMELVELRDVLKRYMQLAGNDVIRKISMTGVDKDAFPGGEKNFKQHVLGPLYRAISGFIGSAKYEEMLENAKLLLIVITPVNAALGATDASSFLGANEYERRTAKNSADGLMDLEFALALSLQKAEAEKGK